MATEMWCFACGTTNPENFAPWAIERHNDSSYCRACDRKDAATGRKIGYLNQLGRAVELAAQAAQAEQVEQ